VEWSEHLHFPTKLECEERKRERDGAWHSFPTDPDVSIGGEIVWYNFTGNSPVNVMATAVKYLTLMNTQYFTALPLRPLVD